MASLREMQTIKDKVRKILTKYQKARDNDNLLIVHMWTNKNNSLKSINAPFRDFAEEFIQGKYPSSESIRRVRQKLQELEPNLRGLKYAERHKEEGIIRTNIRDL